MTGHLATSSKFVMIELLIPAGQTDAVSEETLIHLLGLQCHDNPRQSLRKLTRSYYSCTGVPVLTNEHGYLFRPAADDELSEATARVLQYRAANTESNENRRSGYSAQAVEKVETVGCDRRRKD